MKKNKMPVKKSDTGGKKMHSYDLEAKKFTKFNSVQMFPGEHMEGNPVALPSKQNKRIMNNLKKHIKGK